MKVVEDFIRNTEKESDFQDRPLVTLTYAQSLDGSIARRRGIPLALSSQETLQITHSLRSIHEGIMVGIGTVLSDNPRLTTRGVEGPDPQPIILDPFLKTSSDARIFDHPKLPWFCTGKNTKRTKAQKLEELGCRVLQIPSNDYRWISIEDMLKKIREAGIQRLMVEGGARVIEGFLRSRLVDVVVITIAPVFVGGLVPLKNLLAESSQLSDFPQLSSLNVEKIGKDILVWGNITKDY